MKTAYSVAGAVGAYRRYIDGGSFEDSMRELYAISHRPYSTGFYLGEIKDSIHAPAGYLKECDYIGRVLSRENGRICVQVKNKLLSGQAVEALVPKKSAVTFAALDLKDIDGNLLKAASVPDSLFTMPAPEEVEEGAFLRVRK